MGLEASLGNIVSRFDRMAGQVDTAIERLDNARDEFPAINLLKNARARETDASGDLVSPLSLYIAPSWSSSASQRVLPHDHADVPQALSDYAVGRNGHAFNVIEVTVSANGRCLPRQGRSGRGQTALQAQRRRGHHSRDRNPRHRRGGRAYRGAEWLSQTPLGAGSAVRAVM